MDGGIPDCDGNVAAVPFTASASILTGRGEAMTRRNTRILWGLIGVCLFTSVMLTVAVLIGPPDWLRAQDVRRLEVLIDVSALLFWLLIFGFYWTNNEK